MEVATHHPSHVHGSAAPPKSAHPASLGSRLGNWFEQQKGNNRPGTSGDLVGILRHPHPREEAPSKTWGNSGRARAVDFMEVVEETISEVLANKGATDEHTPEEIREDTALEDTASPPHTVADTPCSVIR